MYPSKLVAVSKGAFAFCRYSVSAMLWIAFLFRIKWLVLVSFLVLLFSALLRIQNAPLIFLYRKTLHQFFKTEDQMLDEYGMLFAHSIGAFFSLLSFVFLCTNEPIGWSILFFLAILKTVAAFGFCSALKFYGCMSKGDCCSFSKKINDLTKKITG